MADLDTFRGETRAWLEANCPPEMRQPMRSEEDACWGGRSSSSAGAEAVARRHGGARLDRARLAERVRRRRAERGRDQGPQGGDGGDRRAPAADRLRHFDARAGAAQVRHRGAEARSPRPDRARRDPLVPGLLGAGRGLRPRRPADQGRGCGRPLRRQRAEGLDLLRRRGRLDLLPRAHVAPRPSTRASASS